MTLNHVLDCLNHSLDLARLNGFSGHFVSITSTKSCGFSSYKTCNVKIYFNSKVEKESKLICSTDYTSKINNEDKQNLVNITEQKALTEFFSIIADGSAIESRLNGITG